MSSSIYQDTYEFKGKLSHSRFAIFVDGKETGYVLLNDNVSQEIKKINGGSDEDVLSVEEFIESYSEDICVLGNLQMIGFGKKFNELYPDCFGLHRAIYVEELREIHIISNSMNELSMTSNTDLKSAYEFISHNIYKGMCRRYNICMGNATCTCSTLKKKFSGLLMLPTFFGNIHLETDGVLKKIGCDNLNTKLGAVDILYRTVNGKFRSGDVKDPTRVSLIFHKNQLIQQLVGTDRDSVKREFLSMETLHIDLIHLLAFPEFADKEGTMISVGNSYDFICCGDCDIVDIVQQFIPGVVCTKCSYLDFIYTRNNINFMHKDKFRQLVKEMVK